MLVMRQDRPSCLEDFIPIEKGRTHPSRPRTNPISGFITSVMNREANEWPSQLVDEVTCQRHLTAFVTEESPRTRCPRRKCDGRYINAIESDMTRRGHHMTRGRPI
jgi:hypothetical protein